MSDNSDNNKSTNSSEVEPLDGNIESSSHVNQEYSLCPQPIDELWPFFNTKLFLSCYVAGVGYHDIEERWEELHVGKEVALVRQRNNEHDENAVAVALSEDYSGNIDHFDFDYILGYVPKNCNKHLATMLDMGWEDAFVARISEMNESASYNERLKIDIFIKSKAAVEMNGATVLLRTLPLDDEAWEEFKDTLWGKGCVKYRWGGYPQCTISGYFPRIGDKVVVIHKVSLSMYMYLMNVTRSGDDEGMYVDDCSDYTLTNVVGPVIKPVPELDFLNPEDLEEGHYINPSQPLPPSVSERLMNIFREALRSNINE